MKRFILTTATTALMAGATAMPALADNHADIGSMTCADYQALDADMQMEVAAKAIAELDGGGESMRDSATAGETDSAMAESDTTEAEADGADSGGTQVENDGTATATEGGADAEMETVAEADMEALMAACDRNLDAMVLEAAAGMDTQR